MLFEIFLQHLLDSPLLPWAQSPLMDIVTVLPHPLAFRSTHTLQYSRYLENWYLEADLDLEASDFRKRNFLEPKESGFREQSGFRDRGCRHGGCSLNPDYAVSHGLYTIH